MTNNKRAAAGCAAEALVGDHRNEASGNRPAPVRGQLVDRYGHVYSEAVFLSVNMSVGAILKAMLAHSRLSSGRAR